MSDKPIKVLRCCCCGDFTQGRQWHNRDKGYGLCEKCADWLDKFEDEETMKEHYGIRGVHYAVSRKA